MATQRDKIALGSSSVDHRLEHLSRRKEVYLPPISAALEEKPDSPMERSSPGKQA